MQINNTRLLQFPKRPSLVPSPTALIQNGLHGHHATRIRRKHSVVIEYDIVYASQPTRFGRDNLASYAQKTHHPPPPRPQPAGSPPVSNQGQLVDAPVWARVVLNDKESSAGPLAQVGILEGNIDRFPESHVTN